jgi:type IV secretory pathway component VirB8
VSALARFSPWRAQPLARAAVQAKHRQTMDLRAESVLLGRSGILTGWVIGSAGLLVLVGSIGGWLYVLSIPPPPAQFFEVDRSTGIVAVPVTIKDAPTLFKPATDHHYLKEYIQFCENWIPALDKRNVHVCELMSTPDQQARHEVWRRLPSSPPKAVGKNGTVEVDNFRYHPKSIDNSPGGTRSYFVQYDRTVTRGNAREETKTWGAEIDFQYHPEKPMLDRDRDDNLSGLQVMSYTPSPDTPEPTMELPK